MRLIRRRPAIPRLSRATAGGPDRPVTFPASRLTVRVRVALGADLTASPHSWVWEDITAYVRYKAEISITRGRRDWAGRVDAATARLRLDNRDGRFSRRNPLGPYYGQLTQQTPIWITVDPGSGEVTRFAGFVTEWPVRWTDKSGTDSTVPIVCAGVMRRLDRASASRSAVRRAVEGLAPDSYWPLEGDGTAAAGGRPVGLSAETGAGPVAATADALAYGSTAGAAGAASSAELGYNWALLGPLDPTLPTALTVAAWIRLPSDASSSNYAQLNINFTDTDGAGNARIIYMNIAPDGVSAQYAGIDGAFQGYGFEARVIDSGTAYLAVLTIEQSGADISVNAYFDGDLVVSGTTTDVLNNPSRAVVGNLRQDGTTPSSGYETVVSSLAVWRSALTAAQIARLAVAGRAGVGEMAHERVIRVGAEIGVRVHCVSARSVAMGAQPVGTDMAVIREAQVADDGVLYETDWGLGYRSYSERVNADVRLELDFAQQHIAEEPTPADDDQRTITYWTASRPGSSATATAQTATADGSVYASGGSVNVAADSQLIHQAGHRVHLGTIDEDRWPSLAIALHNSPDLIPAWVSAIEGDRVTADNPPSQVNPAAVDTVIEGWTERISPHLWSAALNLSPASAYEVFQIETGTGNRSRLDGRHSRLSSALASGATSATVETTAGKRPWINSVDHPAQFPLDAVIGGERVTITAITGSTSPQTLTLTRSLAKDHAAGARVSLWRPPVIALEGRG